VQDLDRDDVEALAKTLGDLRFRASLFRLPTDRHDQAIEAIAQIKALE
jgi:hypothetical protein